MEVAQRGVFHNRFKAGINGIKPAIYQWTLIYMYEVCVQIMWAKCNTKSRIDGMVLVISQQTEDNDPMFGQS